MPSLETKSKDFFKNPLDIKKNKDKNSRSPLSWVPRQINLKPETFKTILSNGARVFIKPQNETPVVQMNMAFLGGEKIDPKHGVFSLLTQKSWARETQNLSEDELILEFDGMASSHTAFSGKHSLGFQATTLSPFFKRVMELNFEMLKLTDVRQTILDRDVSHLKNQFETRKDNPVQIAFQAFMKSMFEDHYYGDDNLEEVSKLSSVSSKDLSQFIKSHFNPNNLVLSVVGDVDIDQTLHLIENGLQKVTTQFNKNEVQFKKFTGLKKDVVNHIPIKKEQAQIIFGFEGLTYSNPKRATLSVINSLLSGQGGRLFIELRDKASLAYTVSPIRLEGQEGGYFGSYIACDPLKKEKAIQMMKNEFEKLCETPVDDKELESAKKSIIGRYEIALQRNSEICDKMLFDSLYGLDFDTYTKVPELIKAVSAQDLRDLMQQLYSKPKVLVTLG